MMLRMKLRHRTLRLYVTVMALTLPLLLPAITFARPTEDETAALEARLEGYGTQVRLTEAGSTGFTYLLLIMLGVIGIIVLFKDARRSHLD